MLKVRLQLRKVIAIAICLAGSAIMFAQDVITLRNGYEIKAVVFEVGPDEVKYKKFDNQEGPNYKLKTSDIVEIRYKNGTKDDFGQMTTPAPKVQPQTSSNQRTNANSRNTYESTAPPATVQRQTQNTTVSRPMNQAQNGNVASQSSEYQQSNNSALLHIYRPGSTMGRAVSYDLHLDDEVVFRAKNNSQTTVRVTSEGLKTLWAKTETRVELPVNIQFGREYYIRCGVKMGAFVGRPKLEWVDNNEGIAQIAKVPNEGGGTQIQNNQRQTQNNQQANAYSRDTRQAAPTTAYQQQTARPVRMSGSDLVYNMSLDNPQLYRKYRSGSTLKGIGMGLTLGGLAAAVVGFATADKVTTTSSTSTQVNLTGTGGAVFAAGIVCAVVGTPIWIIGGSKKKSARNAYLRSLSYEQPTPHFQFQTSANGLGLAYIF